MDKIIQEKINDINYRYQTCLNNLSKGNGEKQMIKRLKEDYKQALKNHNEPAKIALSSLLAALLDKEKAVNLGKEVKRDLTETETTELIQKEIQIYKEALSSAIEANRSDLQIEAQSKIDVLNNYLPQMLTEEEVRSLAKTYITDSSIDTSNVGLMNKELRALFNGKAEKNVITLVINNLITK